jgi:hypothetical protein
MYNISLSYGTLFQVLEIKWFLILVSLYFSVLFETIKSLNQLLKSWLVDNFFENVNCSTEKHQLLDRQKYAAHVHHFVFEQLIKKVHLVEILSSFDLFCYLLNMWWASGILLLSRFFEQMNFKQMTIPHFFDVFSNAPQYFFWL